MTTINETNVNEIVTSASALFDERVQFEEAMMARTNKGLYEILAKVYALYIKAVKNDCLNESLAEMKIVLSERGIKTQKNTNPITVFIRYVFNSDRKRSYTYTQVLLAAMRDHIAPNYLDTYIKSNNGLEATKSSMPVNKEQQKKRHDLKNAESVVCARLDKMEPKQTLKLNGESVDLSDGVKYAFVIARVDSAGDLELLQALPTSTAGMQNAAIKALAKKLVNSDANTDVNELDEQRERTLKVTVTPEQLDRKDVTISAIDDALNSATTV